MAAGLQVAQLAFINYSVGLHPGLNKFLSFRFLCFFFISACKKVYSLFHPHTLLCELFQYDTDALSFKFRSLVWVSRRTAILRWIMRNFKKNFV